MAEAEAQASEARPAKHTKFSDDGLSNLTPGHSITSSSPASSSHLRVQLKRHPEIWFDDGNIVLVAGDSAIAFRIYRGLLSAQSTVFSDMFTSSTSSPDETFEGCPIVHLSDSPDDLAHLLRVLLPMLQITYRPTQKDPLWTFDEISAVIRLAHKYHIPQIQKQALSSLRDYHFTSSFSVFSNPTPRELEIVVDPVHAICAVNLARLTDTPSMLPLALYRGSPTWTSIGASPRVALANEHFFLISRILDATRIPRCRNPSRCRMSLHSVHARAMSRKVMHAEEKEVVDGGGVLRDWQPLIGKLTNGKSLCGQCLEELAKRSVNERRSVWNRLPEILGIQVGDWGEPEVVAETGPDMVDMEEDSSDDLF